MLQVALADRLHEQRVRLAARGDRVAVRLRAVAVAHRRRRSRPPSSRNASASRASASHATSANAAAAASIVRAMCSLVCAVDGNQASNCEAGG